MSKKTVKKSPQASASRPSAARSGRKTTTSKSTASTKRSHSSTQTKRPKTARTAPKSKTAAKPKRPAARKRKPKKRIRGSRVLLLILLGAAVIGGGAYALLKFGPTVGTYTAQIFNNEKTAPLTRISHAAQVKEIKNANALDEVSVAGFSDDELRECFYSASIDDKLKERLVKMGYADQIPTDQLSYVRVLYYDFNGKPIVGEMVVNTAIAKPIENVFYDLFLHQYQIGKMILPDAYGTRISESYADNNTVGLAFNLTDDNKGDLHARGFAVDLNPLYNPLIKDNGSSLSVFPMEGQLYLDRTVNSDHFIHANDYAVEAFKKEGFVWKGNVQGLNDYKHFEYGSASANSSASSAASSSASGQPSQNQAQPQQEPAATPGVQEPGQATSSQEYTEPSIEQPIEQPAVTDPALTDPNLPAQPPADQPSVEQPVTPPADEIVINPDGTMDGESPMPVDPDVDFPVDEGF